MLYVKGFNAKVTKFLFFIENILRFAKALSLRKEIKIDFISQILRIL